MIETKLPDKPHSQLRKQSLRDKGRAVVTGVKPEREKP